jgi:uncharacterized protein (TIGR00369 family)
MSEELHHTWCMGCGAENPASLHLQARWAGEDAIEGEIRFGALHEGAPGFAHGGAVAAALDEALGALQSMMGRVAVTRRLEVDYLRPAYTERVYRVRARCERIEGRKLWLEGALGDGAQDVATARGLFIEVDAEHFLGTHREGLVADWFARGKARPPW